MKRGSPGADCQAPPEAEDDARRTRRQEADRQEGQGRLRAAGAADKDAEDKNAGGPGAEARASLHLSRRPGKSVATHPPRQNGAITALPARLPANRHPLPPARHPTPDVTHPAMPAPQPDTRPNPARPNPLVHGPAAAKPRLVGLDLLKLVLALLVVTIHANPFRGVNDTALWLLGNGLARVAVPTFFVVAGYHFRPEVAGRSARLIGRYLWLHLLWLTLYLPLWWPAVARGGVVQYLQFWLYGYWQLWFLIGLAIAVAMTQAVWRRPSGVIFGLALTALLAGFALQTAIGWGYLPRGFWPDARNGVLLGFPMFALGYLVRREHLAARLRPALVFRAAVLGLLAVVGESVLMREISPSARPMAPETLLSAALAGPALLLSALHAPPLPGWLARLRLGTLSAGIYFIHVGFVIVLSRYFDLPRVLVFLIAVAGAGAVTALMIRLRLDRRLF